MPQYDRFYCKEFWMSWWNDGVSPPFCLKSLGVKMKYMQHDIQLPLPQDMEVEIVAGNFVAEEEVQQ